MNDPHYDYTSDEIKKNLILLESHFKNYPCPECEKKHLLAIEGLAEENSLFAENPEEKLKFLKMAEIARKLRKLI